MGNKKERIFIVTGTDEFLKNEIIGVCEMIVGMPAIWKFGKVFRRIFKNFRRIKYRTDKQDNTKLIFTIKSYYADWELLRKILQRSYPTKVVFE